jgi:Helix-turn-helix domain
MTTDKITEFVIPRTLNAHEALAGMRPNQQVPLMEWLAYYERSATLNFDIAEINRGHHESNPMTSGSFTLDEPVTGDVRREHWVVPVHGLTHADPDGIVQAIAHRDGTVILHLACGNSRTTVRLDVGRAAQLSTGIWEAAGASQQLTGYWCLGDDQPLSPQPRLTRSETRPVTLGPLSPRSASPRSGSPAPRRRPTRVTNHVAMDTDTTRTIGQRIRRIRQTQDKPLRVIAGLAGMGKSTLHRIERGQRELTLSEVVALANALQIDPAKLIILPNPRVRQEQD